MKVINQTSGEGWALYNGDCAEVLRGLPDNSIGLSVYSPPFANLYVYSDSPRDMGNCSGTDEFMEHYRFVCREIYRATKPGRLTAVHCSDLPRHKWKDGAAGLEDFPGALIRVHEAEGWVFHSRVTVWKDPVTEMQRTKSHGLLYKQLKKDSTASRQGMADYVLVFRRHVMDGESADPVTHTPETFPVSKWQQWASPVWMDIQQTNTLNVRQARASQDEKHICPLQLDLIERCVRLWSNEGDVVLTPFAGIGSELVTALKCDRKAIGIELKPEYYEVAARNCRGAKSQMTLF